jgi:hypothetical protein
MKTTDIFAPSRQPRARQAITTIALAAAIVTVSVQQPTALAASRTTAAHLAADNVTEWSRSGVRHLIGLPGIQQKTDGRLWVTPQRIGFESAGGSVTIESTQIRNLSVGTERFLKGGAPGRLLRTGVPVGGGLAIGLSGLSQVFSVIPAAVGLAASLASQGSEDIVTVEYVDPRDGYHAAVFTMPRHAADGISERFASSHSPLDPAQSRENCPASGSQQTALSLLPVINNGVDLPAEYRALIYEHLLLRLQTTRGRLRAFRSGAPDGSSGCNGWQVSIQVRSFQRGNSVKRALLGPVGLFAGVTSLQCRLVVTDSRGKSLLEEEVSAGMRGDSESLDLGATIAKSIERRILKFLPAEN